MKTSSSSLYVADILKSPKNILRTIDLRYQAFGKARISVNRLISYLNDAEPISIIAVDNQVLIIFLQFSTRKLTRKSDYCTIVIGAFQAFR